MSAELTCRWLKMRRFHAQFRPEAALQFVPYSGDFITNIVAFEFPTGTAPTARERLASERTLDGTLAALCPALGQAIDHLHPTVGQLN